MKYLNIIGGMLCVLAIWIGAHQTPPGPVPPKPEPPKPVVVVEEKPLIDGDGLHVLIVEEVDDRRSLSRDQLTILTSSTLRGWFTDNKAEWHVWDKDMDTTHEPANWQAAMQIPRASLPWLIVSQKGKPNVSTPLPATLDALMDVLKPYQTSGASE